MSGKCLTLYNSCVRVRVREWMQGKFHERLKKQLQSLELRTKSGKRNGIFYTDKEELFTFPLRKTYGSATQNVRVRMAETYVSPKENIKTMETLHDFLPEVF